MNERLSPELEELHAYVDGQLSPEVRQRVDARLAGDPRARKQVEEYAAIRQGLKSLFDPVLQEPIPSPMRRRPTLWRRPLGVIAASLFLLVAGAWIGMHSKDSALLQVAGAPRVVREAAMAYAVYNQIVI